LVDSLQIVFGLKALFIGGRPPNPRQGFSLGAGSPKWVSETGFPLAVFSGQGRTSARRERADRLAALRVTGVDRRSGCSSALPYPPINVLSITRRLPTGQGPARGTKFSRFIELLVSKREDFRIAAGYTRSSPLKFTHEH